jgi:hypothetical protein
MPSDLPINPGAILSLVVSFAMAFAVVGGLVR